MSVEAGLARLVPGEVFIPNAEFENAPNFVANTSTPGTWINGTGAGNLNDNRWHWFFAGGSGVANFDDTTLPPYGFTSMHLGLSSANNNPSITNYQSATTLQRDAPTAIPGQRYKCQVWMKTQYNGGSQAAGTGATVQFLERNAGGSLSGGISLPAINTTTDWTLYTVFFTASASAAYLTPKMLAIGIGGSNDLLMDIWFKRPRYIKVGANGRSLAPARTVAPARTAVG